jgi:hypothetical protein
MELTIFVMNEQINVLHLYPSTVVMKEDLDSSLAIDKF